MQELYSQSTTATHSPSVAKVLRNTYMMLGLTLLFSAVTAGAAMALNIGFGVALIMNIAAIGLLWFVLPRTANSTSGIYVVFAFTGLLGASLGPMLNHYMAVNPALILQALGGTALVFFTLSGYVLATGKDFSFMGGFLMTGLVAILVASIGGMIASMLGYDVSAVFLAISAAMILVMSVLILFQTSQIINGGETNYLLATVNLYIAIYQIFTSLLHLLGATSDD